MYIAAVRIADDFGCDAIGIQYQQGLKDLLPASDLVEGTLNNADRPPVKSRDGSRVLYAGEPLPHFNEVDECAGLDALLTYRVHKALGQPVENTLHDVRWGDCDRTGTVQRLRLGLSDQRLSPAGPFHRRLARRRQRTPAADVLPPRRRHAQAASRKPGEIVWSPNLRRRRQPEDGPGPRRRRRAARTRKPNAAGTLTTPQWPIMHAVTYGVTRDQMMARHKANHIQVAYANSPQKPTRLSLAKAAMADELGLEVSLCGTNADGKPWPK